MQLNVWSNFNMHQPAMIREFELKGARFLCDLKHLFFSQHIKYEVKSGKTSMRNINIVASAVKTVH